MRKTLLRTLSATAIMAAAFSISAYAQTITSVKFTATVNEDDAVSSTVTAPEFESDEEDLYDLTYEETSTSTSAKSAKTYKLTFTANGDNEFASSASSITVQGTGVESITSKTVKDDGATLEVKVKAYPCYQLEAPNITTGYDDSETSGKIVWDKNGAGTVEYYLVYTDNDGETHTKHSTSSSSSLSVSSYWKEYTGSNDDKVDKTVTGFWIRAYSLSSSSNPFIVPSAWVGDGEEPDADLDNFDTWGDWLSYKGISSTGDSVKSSGSSTINTVNTTSTSGGWSGSGSDWYYKTSSGTNQTGWVSDGGNWYYCDPSNNGKMKAGWLHDSDGNWYYMNEQHDGTYGRMLTSWQTINGVTYYFRPNSGGPMGSMICNATVKINGVTYTFNSDGALVS